MMTCRKNGMSIERKEIGDRHNGRATELVREGTDEYIRKPRTAEIERAWQTFLHSLRSEGFIFAPSSVNVLHEGADFHDVEIVKHTPARDKAQVCDYFRRCGALLFFAYLFNSTDLHCENLIACADSPVLVDLETLLTGEIVRRVGYSSLRSLSDSVMNSKLLPNRSLIDDEPTDLGGLTGSNSESKNLIFLDGTPQAAYDYEEQLLEGFDAAYNFAMKNRDFIAGQLHLFDTCAFRQILRPTQTYGKIITLVERQDDAAKLSLAHALLARAYKNDIDPNRINVMRDILNEEIEAVLRSDVPLFFTRGNSCDLCSESGREAKNFLSLSPVDKALKRLDELNQTDLLSQCRVISQALASTRPLEKKTVFVKSGNSAIETIENILYDTFIPSLASGYIATDLEQNGNVFFKSVGPGLYGGICGIMCCCAAIHRKTGSSLSLERLSRLLELYDSIMYTDCPVGLTPENCSLVDGASGLIAALLHISELTGDSKFSVRAEKLASRLLVDDEITDIGDVLGGIAAVCLQLPKLPKEIALPLANALAAPLCNCKPTLTGVAHGAAGIALAMGAVQSVTGGNAFDEKIISLLEWENEYFDTAAGNWRDLRSTEKVRYMNGWCSGAPGIGMARKQLSQYCESSKIRNICSQDIARAVACINTRKPAKRDSLCCGSSSQLMAASALGIAANEIYSSVEEKVLNGEAQLFHPLDTCDMNSGLMQGFAGIGYALAMYGDEKSGGMLI